MRPGEAKLSKEPASISPKSAAFDPRAAWDTEENARAYDKYARTARMYLETSKDLVDVADIREGMTVVDLGCGTGVTTEEVLNRLGTSGRVIGIDFSAAMVKVAKERVHASNVEFFVSAAESFDEKVSGPVDVVLSNSAFWQMRQGETLLAVKKVLAPGGRLAFNLGGQFFKFDLPPEKRPDFFRINQLMEELAHELYGYEPPRGGLRRAMEARDFNEWVEEMEATGFDLLSHKIVEYKRPAEEGFEWQRVPVFASMMLPGLEYEKKMRVYEQVYWEVVPMGEVYSSRWIYLVFKTS